MGSSQARVWNWKYHVRLPLHFPQVNVPLSGTVSWRSSQSASQASMASRLSCSRSARFADEAISSDGRLASASAGTAPARSAPRNSRPASPRRLNSTDRTCRLYCVPRCSTRKSSPSALRANFAARSSPPSASFSLSCTSSRRSRPAALAVLPRLDLAGVAPGASVSDRAPSSDPRCGTAPPLLGLAATTSRASASSGPPGAPSEPSGASGRGGALEATSGPRCGAPPSPPLLAPSLSKTAARCRASGPAAAGCTLGLFAFRWTASTSCLASASRLAGARAIPTTSNSSSPSMSAMEKRPPRSTFWKAAAWHWAVPCCSLRSGCAAVILSRRPLLRSGTAA
mmetsp:Transcript_4189/g.13465  ORF Transcript_4189/g.13465 Transcript_4189/m.13465 type:complete len:341 (+) Transcript_4189:199-1221(+)